MNILNKFMGFIKGMNGWVKFAILFLLFIALTVVSFIYAMPSSYENLYSNLSDTDKQSILTELSKRGIEYKIDDTGNGIEVKKGDATWVRQEMTSLGLPENGAQGYDLFLQSSLGATEEDKQLREIVGTKGQLQQDIVKSFPSIDTANVHLTLPEETSIFDKETPQGSASVTIGAKRGSEVTPEIVRGIQAMVSSAVKGVKTTDVVVIDSEKGVISSSSKSDASSDSTSYEKELQIKSELDKNIYDDIHRSLTTLFGYDNVEINVNTEVNFDEIVQNIEKYDNPGVLRSKNDQTEHTVSLNGNAKQEAGTDSNGEVINYNVSDNKDNVTYQQNKENIIENFEVGKTVETIKKHPELKYTNVVVWVNNNVLQQKQINPTQFQQAVGIAAGLKLNKDGTFQNGQVSVMMVGFQKKATTKTTTKKAVANANNNLMWIIISSVLGFVAIVLLILLILKRKKKDEIVPEPPVILTPPVENEMVIEEREIESPEEKLKRIQQEQYQKKIENEVKRLSGNNIPETAQYIKKLLNQRR